MLLAKYDDVVKIVPSDRTDKPFARRLIDDEVAIFVALLDCSWPIAPFCYCERRTIVSLATPSSIPSKNDASALQWLRQRVSSDALGSAGRIALLFFRSDGDLELISHLEEDSFARPKVREQNELKVAM
jgi:hypothetical protein